MSNVQDLTLTYQMIEDYAPYIKDPEAFKKRRIEDAIGAFGPIVKIENVYGADGSLCEKRYYPKNTGSASWILDAVRAGVDSLPPTPGAVNVYI